MGYCTTYIICIEEGSASKKDIRNITKMLEQFELFEQWDNEWMALNVKWYDYESDMYKLSMAFPHLLFYVHGDGDDSEDLWEDHWQAGKYQHCYAIIPEYNPDAMQEYDGPMLT